MDCPCSLPGKVGVAGGGDARKAGLFGIGRKFMKGLTTLAGSSTYIESSDRSTTSSLLEGELRSEVDNFRRVMFLAGGDRGPVSNLLNVKCQGHDF